MLIKKYVTYNITVFIRVFVASKKVNMKKLVSILVLLFFFSFKSDGQTKRALIVAIGNYPKSGKWD